MKNDLENIVNHRIARAASLLKRQIFRIIALNELNITPEQWIILYYLWQENGLAVGEIASRSKKDFANVTRIVEKLEKLGYVEKRKSTEDSRISNIFILPKADEIKDKIQRCWDESTNIALKGINKTDQKYFLSILDKIENNIAGNLD